MKMQHFLQKQELPPSQKEGREWHVLLMMLSEEGSPCTPLLCPGRTGDWHCRGRLMDSVCQKAISIKGKPHLAEVMNFPKSGYWHWRGMGSADY